jgi:CubicO group peptidase (beta-lactamase class C family)
MEKWKKRTVELLSSLAFGGDGDLSVVPYYPQKIRVGAREEKFFRRSTPQRQGISALRIYNMLSALEGESRANIHSLMVFKGGEVISECSSPGYDVTRWHVSHSMAKTVTGMIVGILVGEGILDTEMKLTEVFPEVTTRDKKFSDIKLSHLLSMTAGAEFAEAGVVSETGWTESFFASTVRYAPGTKFSYNSMNSYILARVCERLSGRPFGELAREKFFAPLGINSYLWEIGPEGVEKGGWGLYMSPESWARVGIMMMSGGRFMGRRILPEEWVRESTIERAVVPEVNGNFNYGYHLWLSRDGSEILFNGMLGQNVWLCPKNDIMVVMTGGNNEIFQASSALEIIRGYLGGEIRDGEDRGSLELLRRKEASFFHSRRWVKPTPKRGVLLSKIGLGAGFDLKWYGIMGSYALSKNRAGMLPLVMRAMQNNFSGGIGEISIRVVRRELYFCYVEGGEEYFLHLGTRRYEENILDVRGEKYLVLAMGEAGWSRYGQREYRIELLMPETASVRRITLRRGRGERLVIDMTEIPNDTLLEHMIESYCAGNPKLGLGLDILDKRIGGGRLREGLRTAFSPTLIAVDKSLENYAELLESENRRAEENYQRTRPIKNIIDKLFGDR